MIDEYLQAAIEKKVSDVFHQWGKNYEVFPDLPPVSTTAELANALRVSDDVLRRMAEDGMPHTHAGRELRFGKSLIIEWMGSGKIYRCEVCANKTLDAKKSATDEPNVFSPKTSRRLAEFGQNKQSGSQ